MLHIGHFHHHLTNDDRWNDIRITRQNEKVQGRTFQTKGEHKSTLTEGKRGVFGSVRKLEKDDKAVGGM